MRIGVFCYGEDIEVEGGCPALIDSETFEKVQELLKITKKAPGRARAKVEYYLASKLYCGECGEKLIAVGGTSQNGEQHHYYRCKGKPQCSKKAERKSYLEWYVSEQVLALLNMDGKKDILAQKVIDAYKAGMETDKVSELQRQIRGVETKLNNVVDLLIERRTDALLKKMDELELQKSELEEQLRSAELAQAHIPTKQEIIDWFDKLKKVDGAENALQKQVINTFVHKVFLWDEKAVIVLTLNNTQETVTFEQIRDYESLAEEKQKPLTETASGSCYISFV